MKYTAKLRDEYNALWNGMVVSASNRKESARWARKILAHKDRYQKIEQRTGVPWHFIALTHYRESSLDFRGVLHNGQKIIGTGRKTTIVPKGRGPFSTFEEAAYDALVTVKGYSRNLDWSIGPYIYRIEGYNGYGYHYRGIPSPYLWGGSNRQKRGKYVRDGVYDPNVWDTQLGVMTLLRALMDLDPSIDFDGEKLPEPAPNPPPPDIEPEEDEDFEADPTPPSPKAEEETKPAVRSKTIWSQIAIIISTVIGAITDWRVLAVLVVALAVFAILDRAGKIDIRGWFK